MIDFKAGVWQNTNHSIHEKGRCEMKANVKSVLMKKYCRVYQAGAKHLMAALPWRSPKMLSGSGAVKKLPEAVRDRGFHKVLIVTGPKIRARGLLNELLEEMKEKKLKME